MGTMHTDEVEADIGLARRLLANQFPHWADLPLTPVASAGTDNAIYRLGRDMCLRLPRRPSAARLIDKECRWLPALAPLPLTIPVPLGKGEPAEGFPWVWSVCSWIEGETVTADGMADSREVALAIAGFIAALQAIDPTGGPRSGPLNHNRGVPLVALDQKTRAAIANLAAEIDGVAAIGIWDDALGAPPWGRPPVWVHGDLQPGNLLARRGWITAVIDFGLLGVGDPACDLTVAWTLLSPATRPAFRAALAVDDATWRRGRGWALYASVIAYDYYRKTNPALVTICKRALGQLLADQAAVEF